MTSAEPGARIAGSVVLAVSLGLLAWGAPLLDGLSPPACSFKARTGRPCVGCGGTRALARAARGDLGGAARLNPLGAWAGLCLWGLSLAAVASLVTGRRAPVLRGLVAAAASSLAAVLLGAIAWWTSSFAAVS